MKHTILFLFLVLSFGAQSATMMIDCEGNDFTAKMRVDLEKKEAHYLEIYSQEGLGPNNLEVSFLASKSSLDMDLHDAIQASAELPTGGKISIENETGSMRFSEAGTDLPLKNCKYSF